MGDQHYAIVRTNIGETPQALADFREKLGVLFRDVWPMKPEWTSMFLVYDKDFDNCSVEFDMPAVVEDLAGILAKTAEIVWSWDHPGVSMDHEGTDRPRQRAWYIKGKND